MQQFFDLSHTVEDGLVTNRGLPAPIIDEHLSREASRKLYDPGTEFHIGRIEMIANTGTYIDSPFHRYPDGIDLSELPLEHLAGIPALVVRVPYTELRIIAAENFKNLELEGKAVLIQTNWSDLWNTEAYFSHHPHVTGEAAEFLRDMGTVIVGIDSLNIDDTNDGRRPVHSILLEAGIPIVEHLTGLDRLPDRDFRFFAVPVKVKNLGSFPVRAFATI